MRQGASQSPLCSESRSSKAVLRISRTVSPEASISCPGAGSAVQAGMKSPLFMSIIEIGYIFGILYKATSPDRDWRIWLYVLNLIIIGTDLFLYFLYRNRKTPVQ